jgi:hypothetical protein
MGDVRAPTGVVVVGDHGGKCLVCGKVFYWGANEKAPATPKGDEG